MVIEAMENGIMTRIGTVRYINGKVLMDEDTLDSLSDVKRGIFYVDRTYTPEDGIKFMEALAYMYGRAGYVNAYFEPMDTWKEEVKW